MHLCQRIFPSVKGNFPKRNVCVNVFSGLRLNLILELAKMTTKVKTQDISVSTLVAKTMIKSKFGIR